MNSRARRPPPSSEHRRHWALAPGIVFLNHGSFGACPEPVLALQSELRAQMEAAPVQFLWRRFEESLDPSRAALAKFLGCRSRDLVFVTNATTGVSSVLRSLRLRRGDELLTTDHNYNACHNALVETAARSGARLRIARIPFPVSGEDEIIEPVLRAVTGRTRLVLLDHVTSTSALVFPLEKLVRELDARGVDTLVDGAHAPGMIPVNLGKLGAAYYTGNLHKWVCAPKGAAFLWAREDKQQTLQPAVISHGNNRPRVGYSAFQDRFDWAGTADVTAWFCVGEAIRWLGQLLPGGWRELRARNHALAVQARRHLCERLGVMPPCPERMLGSMATLPLPERLQMTSTSAKIAPEQLRLYDEFGIEMPIATFNGRRFFRISAQIYNALEEYEYLAEALEQI